jgi:predicted dehydrogenase
MSFDAQSDPTRVAVIGMGYWGPNLVRVLNGLPEAEVACVCDKNSQASVRSRRIGRFPVWTMDEILADPTIDAVAIATPVSTHAELATAVLEAGKHVFVEKPLATSAREALSVMELAAARGLVLMPGHTFLYSPPVNLARDLIQSGELGDVYFISMSRVNLGLHQPDVSVTWDLAPHDFSILCHWLEEVPLRVSAVSRSCIFEGTPDVAFINLQYPSGAIVHVELSWLAPSKLRRTAVVGSRKMLVYDDTSPEPIRVFDSGADIRDPETFGEYRLSYRTGAIVSPPVESSEPLELELADFCRCVRTGDTPRSNADLAFDVVRMVEAVDRSLDEGGIPVGLEELSRSMQLCQSRCRRVFGFHSWI